MKTDEKKKSVARKMLGWREHGSAAFKYTDFHKRSQKGKGSLNIPKGEKNEGNTMMEGRNENNRQ